MSTASVSAGCELVAEVADRFGEVNIKVTGDSMLPSVMPGDVLAVRRQPLDDFEPGQIAVFRRSGGLVAHRVTGRAGHRLVTRGDSLRQPDAPVGAEALVGRVVAVRRGGRAVEPTFTPSRRVVAWVLRRSELLSRAVLRVGRPR